MNQKAAHENLLTLKKLGLGGGVDPEEERDPPPKPTKVTFPADVQLNHSYWNGNTPPPKLFDLFSKIRQPNDISAGHVEALNITVISGCSFEDLVPLADDGTPFFPAVGLEQPGDGADDENALWYRKQHEFAKRYSELQYDNHQAYSVINRTAKGPATPRVAFLRRFWEGLEDMSRYWDCSRDYYFELETTDGEENSPKRQRTENVSNSAEKNARSDPSVQVLPGSEHYERTEHNDAPHSSMSIPPSPPTKQHCEVLMIDQVGVVDLETQSEPDLKMESALTPSSEKATSTRPHMRYRGYRTSTGRDMPDSCRSATVHGFMEAVAWPFSFSVAAPKLPPRLQVGNLILPVRQNAAVYRTPRDRSKARKGWRDGPVIGIQTRPETSFEKADASERLATARLDLLRELGAVLQIAQERHREGKAIEKPGEGKWWTSTPRWGSPTSDGHTYPRGADPVAAHGKTVAEEASIKRRLYPTRPTKKTPMEIWEEIKSGPSMWDPKIEYTKIGKDPRSEYDQVSLLYST